MTAAPSAMAHHSASGHFEPQVAPEESEDAAADSSDANAASATSERRPSGAASSDPLSRAAAAAEAAPQAATFIEHDTVPRRKMAAAGPTTSNDSPTSRLNALRQLYEEGFITQAEYNERRWQIIDDATGTRTTTKTRARGGGGGGGGVDRASLMPITVTHRPPPDFSAIPAESAIKHTFNPRTGKWTAVRVKAKIESEPFARGGLRKAYHLLDLSESTDASATFVAKIAIDPDEDRESYFQDAEMQNYSMEWARKFNESNPPKKIDFVKTWIIELVDRPEPTICAVERYIAGPYRKHNNNYGFVDDDERNTPQAFSHFTYEASGHRLLICDIQGVGDLYTDPQMHTINGQGFGKGNLGQRGFEKFLSTHRCNSICKYLRLPPINAKLVDLGTVPATPYMSYQRVDVLNVNLPPSSLLHQQLNATTPLLSGNVQGRPRHLEEEPSCWKCCTLL